MAEAHHLLDKDCLLLVVEACEQRLGRVGDIALIDRAVIEKLGLVAHLLDNIVGRVALGAGNSQVEPIGAVMAEIMLLLLGRKLQFGLDPIDVGIAGGNDLFGGQLRLALLLGKHRLLLGALCAFAGLGGFRRASLLRSVRGGRLRLRLWLWLWLSVLADAQHAGKYAE